jgi:hypothetical protein
MQFKNLTDFLNENVVELAKRRIIDLTINSISQILIRLNHDETILKRS